VVATQTIWKETPLGDIVEFLDHKRVPLNSSERVTRQGAYPYYGASGVIDHIDDYIFDGTYLLVAEDGENLNSRKTPVAFFANGKFWVNNHAHIIRAIGDKADDYFIKAWFDQANISGYITGAAQPKLSQANLRGITLSLPPLPTQKKIAAILSAYDDLIENNQRRIKILEEMAQNLYREWFVKFRFPLLRSDGSYAGQAGHEKVKMVDSPLGKIPQGWEVKKLYVFADVNVRSIKKGEEPDNILYVDIASVTTGVVNQKQPMTFAAAPGRARRLVRHGDVVWSCVRPNRKSYALLLNPESYLVVSTGFAVISANGIPFTYLYHALTTDDFVGYLTNHARGAAYPAVTAEDFQNADVLLPSPAILDQFHDVVCPMLELKHRHMERNRNLRQTRDLLLPKLISGEIDVSELDIEAVDRKT
jgi:type I restriction enzyme, S subunit